VPLALGQELERVLGQELVLEPGQGLGPELVLGPARAPEQALGQELGPHRQTHHSTMPPP